VTDEEGRPRVVEADFDAETMHQLIQELQLCFDAEVYSLLKAIKSPFMEATLIELDELFSFKSTEPTPSNNQSSSL
jgi:hypothetical protein